MEIKKIIVVFKTHFDIGFTELAEKVISYYSKGLMPDVIRTCEKAREYNPDLPYVWTMSSWPLKKILTNPETEKDVREKALKMIDSGELTWHMLPYTTHTEFTGIEEYVRGLLVGDSMNREFGKEIYSAKMTDVPGHTRQLPSILAKAGIRFLHLGCNAGCTPPDVPRLFWWKGPDGGKVLTFYNKGGYGSSLLPPKDWKFPVWLALIQSNDNAGPHQPEVIAQLAEEAQSVYPQAEVQIGTLDDFYEAICPYLTEDIPVITEDLADTWIHGVESYPEEVGMIRTTRNEVKQAEALSLLLHRGEGVPDDVYENLLLFGEHTWGLDVKNTLGYNRYYKKNEFLSHLQDEPCKKMERSWEEQRERARKAETETLELAEDSMKILCDNVDCPYPHLTLFNMGTQREKQWIDISKYKEQLKGRSLLELPTENPIPRREGPDGSLWVQVSLPAMGYTTFAVGDYANYNVQNSFFRYEPENLSLDTPKFHVKLNPETGAVSSLVEKDCGKEWVLPHSKGLFLYQYDKFALEEITEFIRSYAYRIFGWLADDLGRMSYPDESHETFLPALEKVEYVQNDEVAQLLIWAANPEESVKKYGNCRKVKTTLTFYSDSKDIDVSVELQEKQGTPYVESGHIIFPLFMNSPRILVDKMGQTVDIATEIRKDANHSLYCTDRFIRLEEGENSVTITNRQAPLWSVGENGIYRFRKVYTPSQSILYSNLFNNSWGTNFPQWMGGDYRYEYRVSFAEKCVESAYQHSEQFVSTPLLAFSETAGRAIYPSTCSLISLTGNAEILAFKKQEAGNDYILRVKSCSSQKNEVLIHFCKKPDGIAKCNILERNLAIIENNCEEIRSSFAPYEIQTFRLSFDSKGPLSFN